MAGQLDRILDPYQITPLFVCFPLLDAPVPAPLASAHCQLAVCVTVWRNLPSVASTGPILRQSEIVTFVTMASRHDGRRCCLIKTRTNNRKCDRKRLLDVIYTGVGVGGGVSPSPASALSISDTFVWTPPFPRRSSSGTLAPRPSSSAPQTACTRCRT